MPTFKFMSFPIQNISFPCSLKVKCEENRIFRISNRKPPLNGDVFRVSYYFFIQLNIKLLFAADPMSLVSEQVNWLIRLSVSECDITYVFCCLDSESRIMFSLCLKLLSSNGFDVGFAHYRHYRSSLQSPDKENIRRNMDRRWTVQRIIKHSYIPLVICPDLRWDVLRL